MGLLLSIGSFAWGGGDYPPDKTVFACADRKKIIGALAQPESVRIEVAKEAWGLRPTAGWCPAAAIELVPYSESPLDTEYAVRCGNRGVFNVRFAKQGDPSMRLSIWKYRSSPTAMKAEKCSGDSSK